MARPLTFRIIDALTIAFLTAFASPDLFGEEDLIKARLERAYQKYQNENEVYKVSVIKMLEGKIAVARKAGNKLQIDSLTADLDFFESDEVLPLNASVASRRKQATLRAKLEKAYESAIKEYSKASQDAQAKDIELRLKEFREAPVRAVTKRSLLGTWQLKAGNYNSALTFQADGTVKYATEKVMLPWTIDVANGYVVTGDPDAPTDKIKLPLDENGTTGLSSATGNEFVIIKKK